MNPPYINRTNLQGRIVSKPTVGAISKKTNVTMFQLLLVESWLNAQGERCEHRNRVNVEVVGRDSARVARDARQGDWVTIEGYIRTNIFKGQEVTKVRTLTVDLWRDT